jgi:hypothetical protein
MSKQPDPWQITKPCPSVAAGSNRLRCLRLYPTDYPANCELHAYASTGMFESTVNRSTDVCLPRVWPPVWLCAAVAGAGSWKRPCLLLCYEATCCLTDACIRCSGALMVTAKQQECRQQRQHNRHMGSTTGM